MSHNDLRLVTLGGLSLESGELDADSLNRQRRKLAVLVVLALGKRAVSRDTLAEMFWGDQDDARARHSLAEALSHIRRVVGKDAVASRQSELSLNSSSGLIVDARDLADAAASGDHERAVALYRGPFLEGVHFEGAQAFSEWADAERARLEAVFTRSAAHECMRLARARQWETCAHVAAAWLSAEPLSADAALYRLNALKVEGDRPSLQRTLDEYERLRKQLREEYDLDVDARVSSLADRIAERLHDLPPQSFATTVPDPQGNFPIAAVAEPPSDVESVPAPRPPAPQVPAAYSVRGRYRRAAGWLAGAVALVALAMRLQTRSARDAVVDRPKIAAVALIPFSYIGQDSAEAYLAHGISEEVSTALSGVEGLRVLMAARRNGEVVPASAGSRAAGRISADAVMEGSVRSEAGRMRVTVRLTNAATADVMWGETYDRGAGDVLTVEGEIARRVVDALRARVGAPVGAVAARRPVDARTYELYLRGRHFENRSGVEALGQAASYYGQALARDSAFAPAWAGLASVGLTKLFWGYAYGEIVPAARAQVERALQLDSTLAAAHVTYAGLLREDWRWLDASRELERALVLNPSEVTARHSLSHLYFSLRRPADALREARAAAALDPLNPRIAMHLCVALSYARRYDAALEACRSGLELDPAFPDSHSKMAWVLMALGRTAEARLELDLEMARSGRVPTYVAQLALIDAHDGQTARARRVIDSLERHTPEARANLPLLAQVMARVGDRDRALALLARAVSTHAGEISEVMAEPEFDSLASDPRFQRLAAQVGVPIPTRTAGP